ELHVELRPHADHGEAPPADRHLLPDRVVAAEQLLFELVSENADRRLLLHVARADEASIRSLAPFDVHERRRDAVDVDAARHCTSRYYSARLPHRTDGGDDVAVVEILGVLHAQAAREMCLGHL